MTTPTKRYVGCAGSPEFCTMAQVGQNWTCMSDPLLPCRLPPCATISMFLNAALILASPPLPCCLLVSLSSVSIVLQVAIMCDHQSSILNSLCIHCPAGGHHVQPSALRASGTRRTEREIDGQAGEAGVRAGGAQKGTQGVSLFYTLKVAITLYARRSTMQYLECVTSRL